MITTASNDGDHSDGNTWLHMKRVTSPSSPSKISYCQLIYTYEFQTSSMPVQQPRRTSDGSSNPSAKASPSTPSFSATEYKQLADLDRV